jgi:hypothetical protein
MGFRNLLIGLAMASVFVTGLAAAHDTKPARTDKTQGSPAHKKERAAKSAVAEPRRTRLVLLPVDQATDALGNGCWVRFYDDKNFKGDELTVVGPVDLSSMKFHRRYTWGGPDSLIAGPKAKVIVYDAENFKDRSGTINPGEQAKDLSDKTLGLFEDIESVKIACNP